MDACPGVGRKPRDSCVKGVQGVLMPAHSLVEVGQPVGQVRPTWMLGTEGYVEFGGAVEPTGARGL